MNSGFYYKYFGIVHAPFGISPQPDFFFGGASRDNYLKELIHFARHGEGIALIVGEVGSGKTMEISMLLRNLSETKECVPILISNSMNSLDQLISSIALQLEIEDENNLRFQIEKKLIDNFADGLRTIVLIDEAQCVPIECLEYIRILSNLETSRGKMLQVIMAAQPEILTTLSTFEMRAFSDRVTLHISIRELTIIETRYYIDHRLRLSGYRGDRLFDDGAIKAIAEISNGLNRRIHLLADKALMAAFADSSRIVNTEHVKKSAKELFANRQIVKNNKINISNSKFFNPQFAISALLLVIVFYGIFNTNILSNFNFDQPKISKNNNNNDQLSTINSNQRIEHNKIDSNVSNNSKNYELFDPLANDQPDNSQYPKELVKITEKAVNGDNKIKLSEDLIEHLKRYNKKINWQLDDNYQDIPNTNEVYGLSKIVLAKANEDEWYIRILSIKYKSANDTETIISNMRKVRLPTNTNLVVYRYKDMLRAIVIGFKTKQHANSNIHSLMLRYDGIIATNGFYSLPVTHLY